MLSGASERAAESLIIKQSFAREAQAHARPWHTAFFPCSALRSASGIGIHRNTTNHIVKESCAEQRGVGLLKQEKPSLHGFDLARPIRRVPQNNSMPTFIMTGCEEKIACGGVLHRSNFLLQNPVPGQSRASRSARLHDGDDVEPTPTHGRSHPIRRDVHGCSRAIRGATCAICQVLPPASSHLPCPRAIDSERYFDPLVYATDVRAHWRGHAH